MARSARYVNFSVSIKAGSGSLTVFTEIQGVKIHRGHKQLVAYGDARLFPTLIVNVENKRTITLAGGDVSKILALDPTLIYQVAVTLLDAKNGVGTGAVTATLINAVIETDEHSAGANEWGGSTVTFEAFSSDGATDPLTVVEAT